MNPGSSHKSDSVTLLVFKDNYAARTFQVPLSWISKFGFLLGLLVFLAISSVLATVKYYRIAIKADPTHIQELEQEVADLKESLKKIESKEVGARPPGVQIKPGSASLPLPPPHIGPLPPTEGPPTEGSGSPPVGASNSTAGPGASNYSSSGFPFRFTSGVPNPNLLPFSIQGPKASWQGRTLTVRFALQYTREDNGNQQGRILILARGPDSVVAYPPEVLSQIGAESLIAPEKGEFFSVSRYREVNAKFGPMRSREDLKEVEILILNNERQTLSYQKFPVQP